MQLQLPSQFLWSVHFTNTAALSLHSDRSAGYSPTSHSRYFGSIPVCLYWICGEQSGTESVVRISVFPFSIVTPVHRIHLSIIDPTQSQQLTASLNSRLKKKNVDQAVHVTVRCVAAFDFSKVLVGFNRQTSEPHSVIKLFVVIIIINCNIFINFHFCVA